MSCPMCFIYEVVLFFFFGFAFYFLMLCWARGRLSCGGFLYLVPVVWEQNEIITKRKHKLMGWSSTLGLLFPGTLLIWENGEKLRAFLGADGGLSCCFPFAKTTWLLGWFRLSFLLIAHLEGVWFYSSTSGFLKHWRDSPRVGQSAILAPWNCGRKLSIPT